MFLLKRPLGGGIFLPSFTRVLSSSLPRVPRGGHVQWKQVSANVSHIDESANCLLYTSDAADEMD